MKSEQLKEKINSVEDQILTLSEKAEEQIKLGGELMADGLDDEGVAAFNKADDLIKQVDRLESTLTALKSKLATAKSEELEVLKAEKIKSYEIGIKRDVQEQSKRLQQLCKAWENVLSYESSTDDRLSGVNLLGSLFREFNPVYSTMNSNGQKFARAMDIDKITESLSGRQELYLIHRKQDVEKLAAQNQNLLKNM